MHAVKAGLSLVTGDCFLVLAADLQDPPELILRALERRRAGSKYVLCARASREDPPATRLMSGIYYRLLRLTVTPDYPEGGYDVALMDKCFLPYLINSSKNVNPFLFAFWLGYSPDIITYERRARKHGKSRWTLSKKVKFFLDSLLGFSVVPIRFISVVGIVVSCLSFLYGVFIIVCALAGIQTVHGFPTIVTLISFLLGLIIVMLGVIGEYIWRIFDELNRRPESVIDEIY